MAFNFDDWRDQIDWIQNGEPVEASVANRPTLQVWNNLRLAWDILVSHVTDMDNPHRVTARQLGIDLSGAENLKEFLGLIVNDIAGSFVAEGFDTVVDSINEPNSEIKLRVTGGRAYLFGNIVNVDADTEISIKLDKFPSSVSGEPKLYNVGKKVFTLNEYPLGYTTQVLADIVVTELVTRDTVPGGLDYLSNTPVLQILSVKQGTTTFVEGQDFILNGNAIDWSPAGNEPAGGTTYEVTYVYRGELVKDVHYKDGSNLSAGTYYYFVAPATAAGDEAPFDPAKVKSVTVSRDGKYVVIYWNAVTGADKYRIYASSDGTNFYLAGETTGTSFEDYGVWDTSVTPSGSSTALVGADITTIEDKYSRAIVLISDPGIQDATYLLVSYVWYMPSQALIVLTRDGILDVVYGAPDREPVPPTVPGNSLPIARLYVPGLDPEQFKIYDVRAKSVKFDLINSILHRLSALEEETLREKFRKDLEQLDFQPKTGIFADNFVDDRYIDFWHPDFNADYVGTTIESKRINEETHSLEVSPSSFVSVKTDPDGEIAVLDYDEVVEIAQEHATRTIDVTAATFPTEVRNPVVWITGIHAGPGEATEGVLRPVSEGMTVTINIAGFDPAEPVSISIGGVALGTIIPDANGSGSLTVTIPNNLIDESVAQRLAQFSSTAIRRLADSIVSVLRTAERRLWPVRVVSRTRREFRTGGRRWRWWLLGEEFRVVETTVQEISRLGVTEEESSILDVGSIVLSSVRADQQNTGKFAIRNIVLTSRPVTIPVSIPVITRRVERRVSTRSWTVWRWRWFWWWDPVAESFVLDQPGTVTAIEVRFSEVPSDPNQKLVFKVGVVKDGIPSDEILDTIEVTAAEIANAINNNNGWYKFTLHKPIYVDRDTRLFFSLGSTAPGFRVYYAKLGDQGVSVNPYPAGTFFYSGDGETWTPIQEQDLTFRVYTARFKSGSVDPATRPPAVVVGSFEFNEVNFTSGASALAVDLTHLTPEGTSVYYYVSTDGGNTWKPVENARDTLLGAIETRVRVRVVLASNSDRISPMVVLKSAALHAFSYANSSTYVSSMFKMLNNSSSIDVYVFAHVPPGQSLNVYISPDDGANWYLGTKVSEEDWDRNRGIKKYVYNVSIDTNTNPNTDYRLKIEMTCDGINPVWIDKVGVILR